MGSIWINGVKQKLWKEYYGYKPSDPDIYEVPLPQNINVGTGRHYVWGPQKSNNTYFTGDTHQYVVPENAKNTYTGFTGSRLNPKSNWKLAQATNFLNAAKYTGTSFTPQQRTTIPDLFNSFRPVVSLRQFDGQVPATLGTVSPEFRFQHARGDFQLIGSSLNTDVLGNINFQGYTNDWKSGANIRAVATQNWTTSTRQTKIQFQVMGTNTNSISTPVEITDRYLKITGTGLMFPDGTIQTTAGGGNNPTGNSGGGANSAYDFGSIEIPSGTAFDGGPIIV
jgi:hypothetical protein